MKIKLHWQEKTLFQKIVAIVIPILYLLFCILWAGPFGSSSSPLFWTITLPSSSIGLGIATLRTKHSEASSPY